MGYQGRGLLSSVKRSYTPTILLVGGCDTYLWHPYLRCITHQGADRSVELVGYSGVWCCGDHRHFPFSALAGTVWRGEPRSDQRASRPSPLRVALASTEPLLRGTQQTYCGPLK